MSAHCHDAEEAGAKLIEYLENDPFAALARPRPRWISGILGGERPSRYSESPVLWNALFKRLGLDAVFLAFDLPRVQDLPNFLRTFMDEPGALDLTITNPYKAPAWDTLSRLTLPTGLKLEVSVRVEALGCLNHLIVDRGGGRLIAENTDGIGMCRALEDVLGSPKAGASTLGGKSPLAGRRILLAGSGGAAASIGWELVRMGARLTIVNIVEADARLLAARLAPYAESPIEVGGWDLIPAAARESEIIVSAISAGTPLDAEGIARLPSETVFADARYGAAAEFAQAAAEAGRLSSGRVVDGRAMLFGQFAAAVTIACPIAGAAKGVVEQVVCEMKRKYC
ncbi:MAG: hypothetical protein WCT14_11880 [Treponemataceae bacterium]